MEGLANYGSDDEASSCDESPLRSKELPTVHDAITIEKREQEIDNYEDVGMDLSEHEGSTATKSSTSPSHTPPSQSRNVTALEKCDERKVLKDEDSAKERRDSRSRSRGRRRRSASSRSRSKSRSRSRSKSHSRRRDNRDKEKHRDKSRKDRERERGGSSKSSNRRRSRSRSRSRERNSRENRRHRDQRDSRTDRDQRDGGHSRENREFPANRYSKRFDRACNKLAHLEKMGIDVNKSQDKKLDAGMGFYQAQQNCAQAQHFAPAGAGGGAAVGGATEDRLLPPGVTGRLREQMERRKALWQKKPEAADVQEEQPPGPNTSGKVWQSTTFAHDQEGKQANKFKRLMGIRETPAPAGDKSTDSVAKKQEELFSSMEQQYEVARTATHTMRGVGLGFGSYQR